MIQCVSGASAAIQEREEFCMTRENTPTVKNTKKRRKLGTGGLTMARYFKITEIDCDSFFQCTGEELDCSQLVVPVIGYVFVAVDDTDEDEISVPLDSFDEED